MKAIILSAGHERGCFSNRWTPKCAVTIHGQSMIEWQIGELIKRGIEDICVVLVTG